MSIDLNNLIPGFSLETHDNCHKY